jgi:hypothetical protein
VAASDSIKLAAALVLGAAALFAPLAGITLEALAQDQGTETSPEDSTQAVAGEDEEGVEPGDVSGARGGPGKAPEGLWEAHPTYTLKINKRKDVTNWDSDIKLAKQLSTKLSLNLSASVATRENSTLNRSDANNGTNAALRYKLNNSISFGMNYNTSVTAYRYDLSRGAPAERRKNQDVTVTSDLTRRVMDSIDLSMRATAGSTSNGFEAVSNEGRRMDLMASVTYAPASNLRASTTFTGKRLFLDSKVDSGGMSVFQSQDNTFSENLAFSLTYEMLPGLRLGMDASNNEDQRQHPEPIAKVQETEMKSSKNASVTSAFDMFGRFTWDMAVRFNSSDNRYIVRRSSNNKSRGADLTASAKILPWRAATVNVGGEREVTRDEYETADTGDNLHKSLSFKLAQGLGPKADFSLSALSDLSSATYDDKQSNPRDRDRLSNRVALDANYKPYERVSTRFGSEFSEEYSVYLRAEESANNRTTTRYRVYGTYDLNTLYGVSISQTYEVGAVYTIYRYSGDDNSLVRNSNVSTSFRIPVTPALGLNLDHNYKYQDQGSYREEGNVGKYGRAAANRSNSMGITLHYTILRAISLNMRQSYYVQTNWNYEGGKKVLDYETKSTDISGRVGFKHKFGERTNLSLSVERNRSEGSRISAAFKRYWNVEMEASHAF